MSEFERFLDARHLPAGTVELTASPAECTALAARFDLVAVERLEARVKLDPEGTALRAAGRLSADIVQSCAVSGENLAVRIDEPVALRFVTATIAPADDEEIEFGAGDVDEIEFDGTRFDLGEALAQSLALAIDPFATGPGADEARRRAGLVDEAAAGPFAVLKGLQRPGDPEG